ncbi:hypothetical protein J6590_044454 [Homalodisca vitripennis]|nr:hypothetical protein J6590_044454 [Homalodisca vitripennis]
MEKTIDAWLAETADIPSDPESEDNEDHAYPDVVGGINDLIGSYIVMEDGILEVDHLDLAQTGEIEDVPILILNENDFQVPCGADEVENDIPAANAVNEILNEPVEVQFDKESEPLAQRTYKENVTWHQNYYSPNKL